MKDIIKPNTFLIGVQKSATTSLYNWLSQHPNICAPSSLKDIPFFLDDNLYSKGLNFLNETYIKYYRNEKVVFQGNVNYIFFEKSIKRIHEFNPNAKFILVLRNPVDRAISSYFFARKRGIESKDILNAFENEKKIIDSNNLQDLCELTYRNHGLYAKQLKQFFKYFNKNQLCILLFDDLKNEPQLELDKIYKFLDIEENFKPKLNYLNETGNPRSKIINKLIYKDNKLKKIINDYIADPFFSFDFKIKVKLFLGRLFSKKDKALKKNIPESLSMELRSFFKEDILELEELIDKDLSIWKS